MKRNPRLLSTLEMERLIATSAISEAEYLEPDSKETSSWMAYHMGLMPVTDWLLRGIYPYLRAELLNKAFPGKYRTLPAINLNTSEMGAMYKRGIGRNTILGAQFPPFHVPGADYATLSQKANQSNAAFTRKLKSGDYQSTATLGNSRFLYMHYKDISDGSFVDAFSILRAYDVEDMVAMTRDAKHRKNIVKVFGEDFFDLQNPYQRTFPMAKSFSKYLEEAVAVPVHEFITQLLTEMDPAEWVYDEVVDEDDEADVAYIATRYIAWLDKNIRTFDIIAAPQTPSGFPTLRADGGKKIEIVSLSDPQLAQAQMPEGAKTYLLDQSAYFKDTYTAYDFFVDCVLSCREASIHVMVNIPKNVAQWVTQGKDKADDYYLVQILSQAQAELEDYETYQKSPTIAGCVGDQSAGTYANAPIEDTASRLEKRKVNALGVNEKGLGVDDQGRFIYVPTKLNHLGKNRKEIEEYFDAIQVNKGSRILALRDPFDISGNVRVIGKDVTQRPRPKQIGTEVKPLYIDWGIGVLAGISNRGSIIPLLDLKHITKLEDNHYRNYYNAALYPVVTRDNGKWAKSLTDILTATKPNQYNAVTEPLSRIVQKFMPLAVSTDDLTAWAMAEFREVFKTRNVDGMDIELIMNEGTIENSSRIIGRSLAGNDPIGTMTTAIYGPYYSSYHRLMNLFSDESAIPAEFDDIVNIATNGFGDYFTLKDLAKDWTRSPSILTRLFGRILDKIWDLTENRLEMFYEITSVELAHRYYGTISAISDLMRNPRSISPVVHDTSKPAPADYKAEPLAGGREGYAMLPHQVRVDYHNTQMIKDDVKVEILDAQAGAGKTHNILMDVMRRLDANLIKRPLVICPDYLIKNYIEDGAYIYEGRLNVVPLVTLVKNYDPLYGVKSDPMGLEGMLQLVENAPPNTLFVTSYSFLSAGSQSTFTVPIGTDVVYINPHLEMMLEAGFDYICADEFHELRNEGTTKSDMAKALFYRATYRKGATGTFLNTSPSDIPSQTSMLDPTIFGSTSDFFEYYADSDGGKSNRISKLREGRKENLVQSLRGSTGYTQVKRKEWAALLPERKDSYHVLQLDENSVQWRIYQAILQQVLDEIARILEKNKDITRGAESGDEEANENLEALLRPYLQRLEMLLITPALDKDYQILVEGMDLDYDENYVSPAVERTIKIIEAHLYGVSLEGMDQTERGDAIAEHEDFLDLDSITDIDNVKMLPPTPGKILVFCNYNTSVQATYNALPSHLKEQAIMYDAKNKDKHIFEFKNNPNKKILIGIQTSLATGHNFQFCTRLIRQEQVWSPGEVEQGESRINRPDPKNRDNVRGKIFYDWIVIDGTIQVTKLARLISRQVVNTEIEEFGNPAYKDVPHMPILIMNLGTIRNNCWFHAPSDVQAGVVTSRSLLKYLETKRTIDAIQKREYAEWIADYDGPTEPVEVAVKPPIEGSAVIVNIPPIPGQTIANADRFDVVNVAKYETMMGSQDINLVGMKCLTPEGDGEIVRVSGSKLHVVINGAKYSFDRLAVNIYLESGVSREDLLKASGLKKFVDVTGAQVTIGKGSSKKKKADLTDEEILKELNLPKKKKREPELVSMDELYSQSVDFLKSRSQDAEPKVIKTTKRSKPVPEPTDSETGEPDNTIEVMASATNGALCIMLSSEDADLLSRKNTRILKNMGYSLDPDCWYAEIPNKKTLEVLISKLESKFDIPEKQLDLLYEVLDAFSLGRRKLLNAEHSSLTEIKEYWLQDNRRALRKDPNALVPMPVVQDGNLFIMLDMEHPASKRAKRLRIPNVTWDSSGGLWMKMYSSKKAVAADMRALQELFVIADKDTLKEDIKAINISNGTKR